MPERAYQISSGVLLLAVLTIAYGGTFVLSVTRGSVPANDLQRTFFRAGHAHAGVLVTLGLVALTLEQLNHVRAHRTSIFTPAPIRRLPMFPEALPFWVRPL